MEIGNRVLDNSEGSANRPLRLGTIENVDDEDVFVRWDDGLGSRWIDVDYLVLVQKIRDYVNQYHIAAKERRIAKLRALGGADVVADMEQTSLDALRANGVKVGGDSALLDREFTDVVWARGSGGKPFATFTTPEGSVSYFPRARHGAFIAVTK